MCVWGGVCIIVWVCVRALPNIVERLAREAEEVPNTWAASFEA